MSLRGRRVLVTGAGGFIGSHLTERLVGDGAAVRVLLRYTSRGDAGLLEGSPVLGDIDVIRGDIRDVSVVSQAVADREIVFHLAALIGIPYSYRAPDSYIATNVVGTANLLEASRRSGTLLVHTSTSEVYGTAQRVPMDESHPLNAQSPYAASKVGADMLALSFVRTYDSRVVVVRPFNTYGPRQSPRAIIPTIALQLLDGDELHVGTIDTERDLTYVDDMVSAFICAAQAERAIGLVVNCGTGTSVSVKELIRLIGRLIGREPRIVVDPERVRPPESEVELLRADPRLARELMGWTPQHSMEDGLRSTIEWLSRNRDLYRWRGYAV